MNVKRILKCMIHIYQTYRFVKLVNKQNNEAATLAFKKSESSENELNDEEPENFLVSSYVAIDLFSKKRIFLHNIGLVHAAQACSTALKLKYIEPMDFKEEGTNNLRVTEKGLALLDGIPFLRFGLWKAWHEEHGWILTLIPASAFGAFVLYVVQHLFASVK